MNLVLGIRSSLTLLALGVLFTTGCAGFPGIMLPKQTEATASIEDPAAAELALGKLREARGELEAAAEHCHNALQMNPEMVEAYHRLAIIEAKQELYEDSYATFTKALRLSPNSPQLLSDLGYALYLGDRFEMSEKALRKAIDLNPELAVAKSHLAMVLAQSGQLEASDSARLLAIADDGDESLELEIDDEDLEYEDASASDLVEDEADLQDTPETMPLELAAEELTTTTPQVETEAFQVRSKAGGRSKVQPARYVLEQSQETFESDIEQVDDLRQTPHVEQAVYCEVDDACSEDCHECAVSAQPAAALLPVKKEPLLKMPQLKKGSNPLADLGEAMSLLKKRRSRTTQESTVDETAEQEAPIQSSRRTQRIKVNLGAEESASNDDSTLSFIEE